jgi:hypothetical protein
MLLALSMHTITAGMTYGMQQDAGVLGNMLIVVIAHMPLAAFSLGASLAGGRTLQHVIFIGLFAAMFPLGIGLGLGLSRTIDSARADAASAFAMAFCSGTFLYLSVWAILPRELASAATARWRFVMEALFIAGFGAMACVKLLDVD